MSLTAEVKWGIWGRIVTSAENQRAPFREQYLTVAEAADLLRLSIKRVRNQMSSGIFVEGDHFVRPRGIGPRFIRSRLESWLRGSDEPRSDEIPMARSSARYRSARMSPTV